MIYVDGHLLGTTMGLVQVDNQALKSRADYMLTLAEGKVKIENAVGE